MQIAKSPLAAGGRDRVQLAAAIVDSSSDAIVSKTLDGTVLSWNGAAERLFGYSAEEMIGQSIRRIIPLELQGEEDEIIARVGQGEVIGKFETLRRHKDGHLIPVALTVSPIREPEGTIIGASKIAHDLTGEQAERARLKGNDSRLRMLVDNIDQLAWIADSSGWIGWYNKRWYDFTGTTFEEMQGWGWEKVQHPDHLERVKKMWSEALVAGVGWEDTFPLRSAAGEYSWFLSRAHPVHDSKGEIIYWFGTNTDITRQRDNEQRIELLMSEVNHRSKNMLALVQAILHRTGENLDPAFVESFERRIAALSANQELLIRRGWEGAAIGDIVRSQLGAVEDWIGTRISIAGPEGMLLKPSAAEALGLALHELTTNALKYGALSNTDGRVMIDWQLCGPDDEPRFHFNWQEVGGPPVEQPSRSGFGSVLIKRNVESAMQAEVSLVFPPAGLRWKVGAPAHNVVD